ncbi:hypothetical protein KSZ_09500 [Dictyobacter formicarum]|uniref:Uncharacterized protein n=1 Tax=Dictyobacter formicarum TaxID=2778368 RepID=A0ABQ3VB08_9CHLR|nr:hypothetical protein KSZ_09500 [Dictyobacter formicarum]
MIKPYMRCGYTKTPHPLLTRSLRIAMVHIITFSHPDYTVGFGFSPNLFAIDQEAINGKLAGST